MELTAVASSLAAGGVVLSLAGVVTVELRRRRTFDEQQVLELIEAMLRDDNSLASVTDIAEARRRLETTHGSRASAFMQAG